MSKITEHFTLTNETIDRDMNENEIAQMEIDKLEREVQAAKIKATAEAKASAKAKLIAGEPLTAAEADTLVI